MITETREVYKCGFCRKLYQLKRFAVQHEIRCNRNPDNQRPCFECNHLTSRSAAIVIADPYSGAEDDYEVKALHCMERQVYLIPPFAEHKGNAYEIYDETTEPMPHQCDVFASWKEGE